MTVKRRSHGRNKKGRGHVNRVRCVSTGKAIPKDKAIKRFIVRNIVEASALRDIKDASCIEGYQLPKIYIKQYYSVEAAIHQRVVRVWLPRDPSVVGSLTCFFWQHRAGDLQAVPGSGQPHSP